MLQHCGRSTQTRKSGLTNPLHFGYQTGSHSLHWLSDRHFRHFRHSSSHREPDGDNDEHLGERKNLPAKCYTIKTCNILLAWSYDLAGGEKASETVDDLYKFNCGDPSICHLLFVIVIVFVFDINYCVDRLFVICIGHCICLI